MLTDDYRVQIDAFEGPLDLLLFLIRKNEVDIHDIPVASITEQYLAFLEHIERIDIDAAGEFLVMAASLMEIKSRMLNPEAPPETPGSESRGTQDATEDPRAELVRQLLAYKKFRDAATALEHRAEEWHRRAPSAATAIDEAELSQAMEAAASDLDLDDLNLIDLAEAFKRICETVNFERLGEHKVKYDDTPIELHATDILDRLRRFETGEEFILDAEAKKRPLELVDLFRGRSRSEVVGLFLAVLQLLRRRQVGFHIEGTTKVRLFLRPPEEHLLSNDEYEKTEDAPTQHAPSQNAPTETRP